MINNFYYIEIFLKNIVEQIKKCYLFFYINKFNINFKYKNIIINIKYFKV